MHEQFGEWTPAAPGLDDRLQAAIQKRNRELAEYFDHWASAETAANAIRQLLGASETGIAPALATLVEIEDVLDRIHACFVELGCIPRHNGDFDEDSFLRMVLERNIANSRIRQLADLPEEFHDEFRHLFDEGAGSLAARNSEAIRLDLDAAQRVLAALLARPDDFSLFMGTSLDAASARLQILRTELNALWEGFRRSARAAAHQF